MVPIPVFGKQAGEEPSSFADDTKADTRNVPAISVTKPPAPQPVNLPSVNDVVSLPSPPDSNRSSVDIDLEAGRGVRRLVNDNVNASNLPVQTATPPDIVSHGAVPPPEPSPMGEEDTELLADAAPLEAALSPSLSVGPNPAPLSVVVDVTEPSTSLPPTQKDLLADSTVRLVGGGSSSVVDLTGLDDAKEAIVSDATVVTKSGESPKKEQIHDHTKSSSLSSFKRLSAHLTSGRRRKDSVRSNSVKEVL